MTVHFSVDDFIEAFTDLGKGTYSSIFEEKNFARLKNIHDTYGAVFSCFCFYEGKGGKLSDVPDCFAREFQANAHWLRFGFHGWNGDSNYGSTIFDTGDIVKDGETAKRHYRAVIQELERITGGGSCIERYPRIHYYAGTFEICKAWQEAECGILGLISAEDERVCYYHNEDQWRQLKQTGYLLEPKRNLPFWRTLLRLEEMKDEQMLLSCLSQAERMKACLIFTHETLFDRPWIWEAFAICGEYAKEKNYKMGYFYQDSLT